MITLTLYSRPDCHLCETMATELESLIRGRAELATVDISGDAALERRFGQRIPVLAAGDRELSFFRLDTARVEAFLSQTP